MTYATGLFEEIIIFRRGRSQVHHCAAGGPNTPLDSYYSKSLF